MLALPNLHPTTNIGIAPSFLWSDFLDKAVVIIGSTRLTSYDLLLWQAELSAINAGGRKGCHEKSGSQP